MKIDDTDRRILKVLQKSGRISNSDLADKINLSASACHRRVQRLEDDEDARLLHVWTLRPVCLPGSDADLRVRGHWDGWRRAA